MTTQYAQCGELSIAWQTVGAGPIDLLVIPGLVSHVEAFHELPGYTRLLARLGTFARVITFDKRGNGLSDRVADVPSLPERVDDVHAVLDAAGSARTAILGISEGGALAMYFAATNPDRTRALVLFGAFSRMLAAPGYASGYPPEAYEQFTTEMVALWGTGQPLLELFGPSLAGDPQTKAAAARCERLSATPSTLRGLWRMNASVDVRDALPKISARTLVMHRANDRVVPVTAGRWLAEHIAGARYLELPGSDHFPFTGDSTPIVDAIATLLDANETVGSRRERASAETVAASVPLPPNLGSALDHLFAGALADAPFQLGRFTVSRSLGSGGMGTVFLAEDRDLGRPVALKVLHRGDADAYRRFRREAMAVAALSHPSVVQIYELGLDASMPYLVMEYVRGGTLADLGDQPLPWRRAAKLVASAASGLGAAHAVGIVHRDVKPANLLLPERDGDLAKVADFGVAKLGNDRLTHEGVLVGTVGYLSPEQARGESVDARSDVWALGATLYRLLTGTRHVEGTVAEILARTIRDPLPDPCRIEPSIPDELGALVTRLGALDPAERPADGSAVADALESLT